MSCCDNFPLPNLSWAARSNPRLPDYGMPSKFPSEWCFWGRLLNFPNVSVSQRPLTFDMRSFLRLSKTIAPGCNYPTKTSLFPTKTLFPTSRTSTGTSIRASTFSTSSFPTSNLKPSLLCNLSPGRRNLSIQNTTRLPPKAFIRYCSHRRMCQHRGLAPDTPGGDVVDITAGREILPSNVKPTNYHVTLEPNFNDFTFDGIVVIE